MQRLAVALVALLVPSCLWSRVQMVASVVDIGPMVPKSQLIFHGQVISVTPLGHEFSFDAVARFQVDRRYKGASAISELKFSTLGISGHNCIRFKPGTNWIVFANEDGRHLTLVDDCYGALPVSHQLAPLLDNAGPTAQMEADFAAGLSDSDPSARICSIQRLGNLGLRGSLPALWRVVDAGDTTETKWAMLALLRCGDVSVLPLVKSLLARGNDREEPEGIVASQLKYVSDRAAVPDLLEILANSPGSLARWSVLSALAEIKDPRSLPGLAANLADSDESTRYMALIGMQNITHSTACKLPATGYLKDEAALCLSWWEKEGRSASGK